MTESGEDKGSLLLRAVEAITISDEDATAIAEQYIAQSRSKYSNDSDWEHQLRAADRIVKRYAKFAGMVGGASGLSGIIPGLGTIIAAMGGGVADTAVCMKLQVDMCKCLACVFGYDVTSEDVRHLVFLIAATGSLERTGVESIGRLGSQAGVRMLRQYLKGATLQTIKHLFRKIGVTFTRKALEKAIPFGIGVVIGGGANYGLTRYVGKQATQWYIIDQTPPEQEVAA